MCFSSRFDLDLHFGVIVAGVLTHWVYFRHLGLGIFKAEIIVLVHDTLHISEAEVKERFADFFSEVEASTQCRCSCFKLALNASYF